MSKPENPPAFPRDQRFHGHNGMRLRDWFAGQALVGIVRTNEESGNLNYAEIAEHAYEHADAMLAERAKDAPR